MPVRIPYQGKIPTQAIREGISFICIESFSQEGIERFEMWINGEWAAAAVCVSPCTLYCGEFKLSQAENALLLAPKWYKVEIYDGDVIPLPHFVP